MQNAQKTRSKTIDAMEELQDAVKATGQLPPAEAAAELSRVIGFAYESGVNPTNPVMRRAAALLSALEAAGTAPAPEVDDGDDDRGLDQSKLDALFGGFAPPPDIELD